ncbi:50S ribosomal protein L33 [Pueribacillus theae]|uniref:Large ribosomal subunit protein bL33 n=1 Tax=Pueribacillus theae TaxID=2171751 RepID=A0A2U1K724_9BACI|nr:50S ribosomal protein L33 [Pueribacillus theae]PWA12969.1 50S ribosomal protein L33 [Pueribacillus theae]
MQSKLILACSVCGSRNYSTHKNKQNHMARMQIKKFCKRCNAHTIHHETK